MTKSVKNTKATKNVKSTKNINNEIDTIINSIVDVVEVVSTEIDTTNEVVKVKKPRKTTLDKEKELENAICKNLNIELTDLLRYTVKHKSKKVNTIEFYERIIVDNFLGKELKF